MVAVGNIVLPVPGAIVVNSRVCGRQSGRTKGDEADEPGRPPVRQVHCEGVASC
jgi:hypothetical protein